MVLAAAQTLNSSSSGAASRPGSRHLFQYLASLRLPPCCPYCRRATCWMPSTSCHTVRPAGQLHVPLIATWHGCGAAAHRHRSKGRIFECCPRLLRGLPSQTRAPPSGPPRPSMRTAPSIPGASCWEWRCRQRRGAAMSQAKQRWGQPQRPTAVPDRLALRSLASGPF